MLGKEKHRVCKRLSRASWDVLEWVVSFGRSCLIFDSGAICYA